ncbi:hypothetical protein SLEP1_g41261 [Rubroshorea leprosula]|uniref:Uncharacterized protein n=1 Tax=Rubroshorea leprosula TaxID=152421 RepID=A0AAV5L6G7_9ROSI|nr:hypothetical protein SLEP1_g41261 [Rubroshorea leprosula]
MERVEKDKLDSKSSKLDEGILLSRCQANETSANVSENESEGRGKACKASSNAVQMVLKEKLGSIEQQGSCDNGQEGFTRTMVQAASLLVLR